MQADPRLLQLDRLKVLMTHARMYSLPVDDLTAQSDSDDESGDRVMGVTAARQRLQSTQHMYGTPGAQTPPRWVTSHTLTRVSRVWEVYKIPGVRPMG